MSDESRYLWASWPLTKATTAVLFAQLVTQATESDWKEIYAFQENRTLTDVRQQMAAIQRDVAHTARWRITLGGLPEEAEAMAMVQRKLDAAVDEAAQEYKQIAHRALAKKHNLLPLGLRSLGENDQRKLILQALQARGETVGQRLLCRTPPWLNRALMQECAGFLSNVELIHGLGRTNRAWYLYMQHNALAIAGIIDLRFNDPHQRWRFDWLTERDIPLCAIHLHVRHNTSVVPWSRTNLRSAHVPAHSLETSPYHWVERGLAHNKNLRSLCVSDYLFGEPFLLQDPECVAMLGTLDLFSFNLFTGDTPSDVAGDYLKRLKRFPRVLRLHAYLKATHAVEPLYETFCDRMRRGECPGLERIELHVTFGGKPRHKIPVPPECVSLTYRVN